MLSLTATTLKPSILSLFTQPKPNGYLPTQLPDPLTVTLHRQRQLNPRFEPPSPSKKNLYQPFRPPPSPIPPKFRSLDTAGKIEVLADRMGLWFEYAPLISSLYTEGFTPPTIEELTGISGVEQNCLIVGAQVRDSIVQSNAKPELIAAFETGGAELLYEIRRLSTVQRVAAAEYIVEHGDCLSFMLYRKSREHRSPSELRTTLLEQAFEVAVTEKAKKAVGGMVRLKFGEVAGASSVVVLPGGEAEEGVGKINEAPMEFESGGEFGVVEAEKEWRRWVESVAVERERGGDHGGEDREKKTVEAEDGYYLVVTGDGMKLERGSVLKERGVEECLGMVFWW
ncbi:hypothetical protein HID58_091333 [Brassica napus]|uniref:Rubisco accumulation factor 1.1, chloroplastic n=1 Tax=Brassica napus TaxID=3708 RepID=A0ABQ7X3S3_BRANA|nr:hypothetical protein HID58_091333 [Brassica napus]